jgi:hypothetical protein
MKCNFLNFVHYKFTRQCETEDKENDKDDSDVAGTQDM